MTSFSSLLSSIGAPGQTPAQGSSDPQKAGQSNQPSRKPNAALNGAKLETNNIAAGVKRRSEEPEPGPRPKTAKAAKTDHEEVKSRSPNVAPAGRFQLSAKQGAGAKPPGYPKPSAVKTWSSQSTQRPVPKPVSRPEGGAAAGASIDASTSASAVPTPTGSAKRGFASILERAKAAQEAAKAAGPSVIKHKAVEKMTKRERLRMMEEAKAQQRKQLKKTGSQRAGSAGRGSNNVSANDGGRPALQQQKKGAELSYKGTMKKAAEPLAYKGTMRPAGSNAIKDKVKKKPQNEYVSWSDLSDADDDGEEQDEYESDVSSDMEGGFDEVEHEEMLALRTARKEDQEALEEEERHRREKLDRKRRLEQLSKSAAAAKKRF